MEGGGDLKREEREDNDSGLFLLELSNSDRDGAIKTSKGAWRRQARGFPEMQRAGEGENCERDRKREGEGEGEGE